MNRRHPLRIAPETWFTSAGQTDSRGAARLFPLDDVAQSIAHKKRDEPYAFVAPGTGCAQVDVLSVNTDATAAREVFKIEV